MNSSIMKTIRMLARRYPYKHAKRDAFRVLITTVLSQRTRDANTNKAAEQLFSMYQTPKQLSEAPLKRIEKLIRPSGFYRQKAKRIKKISKIICEKYNGRVPNDIEELVRLPGVGRKTAGCVVVFAFDKPAIPVDTHVHRISNRLGIVKTKTAGHTEQELMRLVPKRYWKSINTALVRHGQQVCKPRSPLCATCLLKKICSYASRQFRHR
ncbi:MAG: endonuclease III [Candidatus Aenigmarchaeota archaeon]|nr:endonuclease III [Candidatus Aenigmarchaeota archaeon]